jgi:heat shock protein HtpX
VVEEMKIASALEKMPDVYIIDDPALNAFATGRDPNHSAIAITIQW